MSVINLIKERKSVRSYTGQPLTAELTNSINQYISQLPVPFGAHVKIKLISAHTGEEPVKLGTYGVISGAKDFLVLLSEEGLMPEIAAGYMFEQVILNCTGLGLGTCWLGGTLNRTDFLKQITIEENEKLIATSPVGYKREKKTILESLMRAGAGSDKRKPFDSLFFNNSFHTPLSDTDAGNYKTPLEMVRLAPSASNKQPWRIVMDNDTFHFYKQEGRFSNNDVGIALCHFDLACQELRLKGQFMEKENPPLPADKGIAYVISWVPEAI